MSNNGPNLVQLELAIEHRECNLLKIKCNLQNYLKHVDIKHKIYNKDNGAKWYKGLLIFDPTDPGKIERTLNDLDIKHVYFEEHEPSMTKNSFLVDVFFRDKIFDTLHENGGEYYLECYTPYAQLTPYNKPMESFILETSNIDDFFKGILPQLKEYDYFFDWRVSIKRGSKKIKSLTLRDQHIFDFALSKSYFDTKDDSVFGEWSELLGESPEKMGEIAIETAKKVFGIIEKSASESHTINWG